MVVPLMMLGAGTAWPRLNTPSLRGTATPSAKSRSRPVTPSRANVEVSLYPALQHDLTKGPVFTRVDLVRCQEVVEHIEERYLGNLPESFATGKYVPMTHAQPGQ